MKKKLLITIAIILQVVLLSACTHMESQVHIEDSIESATQESTDPNHSEKKSDVNITETTESVQPSAVYPEAYTKVLGEIKRLTKYAVHYEDEFLQAVMGSTQKTAELERKIKQKELANLQARDKELDGLFERIYEDNLSGKLSDERFTKMSQRYEEEQAGLSERIKVLRKELDQLKVEAVSTDMFLATVRKYTRAKKLTPWIVNELIDHIDVFQSEKINGEWVQKLTIHYNCIGALFIPDTDALPVPDVTVNTRRGVFVTYEPAQNEQ